MKGALAAPQVEAVEAGRQMFKLGGNAIDAAIATAFAQGVVDPQMTSIGGMGTLQVFSARKGEHIVIEFLGRAPLKATPDMFVGKVKRRLRFGLWELEGHINQVGYLSVTTPGNLLGYYEAWKRYGTLPWKTLIEPAIRLAEEGFEIPGELYRTWMQPPPQPGMTSWWETLLATPAAARVFTKGGKPYEPGDRFANPDYARTLRRIAEEGPEVFYTGDIARRIGEDFARHGGLLSEEDLRQYRVRIKEPLKTDYRGYTVCAVPPAAGGTQVLIALNILEGFDLAGMGFGTPEYFHTMAQAQRASFADRARYLGDPDYQEVPIPMLLSREHAREWQERIRRGETIEVPELEAPSSHTTTISAMDEEGNAIAITHTLGTIASGVVTEGLGFMYNNVMHGFDPFPGGPNSIAPGKARLTAMSPTIVLKDGRPYAVSGAPGITKIITGVLQSIVNLIDFKMTPVEAVSAPRIHSEGDWVDIEARAYYAVGEELEKRGHKVVKSIFSYDPFFALVHLTVRDPVTGELRAAADPRGRGGAVEWRG
jgi:gamma-glutamyltranspeptidase/glutathione hydrolase